MVDIAPIKYPVNIPGLNPKDIDRIEGPKSKWVRLTCHLKIKEAAKAETEEFIFNCKTEKVYIKDDKLEIAVKFLALTAFTPIALTAKTIYHLLFPLSLSYQIYMVFHQIKKNEAEALKKGEQFPPRDLTKKIIKVLGKNIIDTVRTPFYMIAMTIVAFSSVVFSVFNTEILYEGRVLYGEMLLSLNWGEKKVLWTIAPCMQPRANLKDEKEKKRYYVADDVIYDAEPGTKMHALNNMTRNVKYVKDPDLGCACLNDLWK